jgi:hypothetical protein
MAEDELRGIQTTGSIKWLRRGILLLVLVVAWVLGYCAEGHR